MRNVITRLCLGLAVTATLAFGGDHALGTWKYNPAKSKSTAPNPPKSRTDVYEAAADGAIKVTTTEERVDGTKFKVTYTLRYGGKEYPVSGGQFDAISVRRVDVTTATFEMKKIGGKYHQTGKFVISRDGKTKTETKAGANHAGQFVESTLVYERQ